jgi:type I restriction enzyme S subunit
VVLSQVKGWEGAIAVCGDELAGRFASPEYRTFRCRPDAAVPGYFAALFRTQWFWDRLHTLTRGVGARRERVRPELFLGLTLPFPNLANQLRAVQMFDRLADVRALQATTAADLDDLLPAVLAEAFAGRL